MPSPCMRPLAELEVPLAGSGHFARVTRCICMGVELAALADHRSIEEIKTETGCGTICGLCLPYIQKRLEDANSA